VFSAVNCACMSVGKAGYGAVVRIDRLRPVAAHVERSSRRRTLMCAPVSSSFCQHRVERVGARLEQHAAAGHRAGDQEGAGFDAVRQHVVMQP
jgi:hypothetical protein